MSSSKMLIFCAFVFLFSATQIASAATFLEENGVVVMEAESSAANGSWKLQRSLSGYSGSGYLFWSGSDSFAVSSAGRGTITYRFKIQKAGNYQFRWRSRIGHGRSRTEHNDSWVRFPTGKNIAGEQALNGWTKVYMNTLDKWVWQSATVDHVGRTLRQYFSAGEHTVQISGRSHGHAIDRLSLYRYSDVSFSEAKFNGFSQSRTVGSSGSSNNTVAATQPAPTPAAEEQTATSTTTSATSSSSSSSSSTSASNGASGNTSTSTTTVDTVADDAVANVAAPVVSVSGDTLSWDEVSAIVVNVHRGNGEWITSLASSETSWQAPSSGTYYLVATGEGSWETWGRSETVTVELSAGTDAAGENNSTVDASNELNLTVQVYSSSAVELFWNTDAARELSFEVRRNNELLTVSDGQSFFEEGLQAGSEHQYAITAINPAGDVVATQNIAATTYGDALSLTAPALITATAEVYSQSALELFWNATDVNQFDVYQDGQLLGQTDGKSYFIENLTTDTEYEFVVKGVDFNGNNVESNTQRVKTYAPDWQ